MRPPKDCWRLTAEAITALMSAMDPRGTETDRLRRFLDAKDAADALAAHVNDSEECEQD